VSSCAARELWAIRRRVEWWAREAGLPDDMVVDLQLALGEAVASGVEHAYREEQPGDVAVALDLAAGPEPAVSVRVTDHGRWRTVPDEPGHRGRGLFMIELLARRVRVLCTPRGTEVLFEIPFPA
jgi:anti-sigma regulatory factor (Ser/Thr protein kinase)